MLRSATPLFTAALMAAGTFFAGPVLSVAASSGAQAAERSIVHQAGYRGRHARHHRKFRHRGHRYRHGKYRYRPYRRHHGYGYHRPFFRFYGHPYGHRYRHRYGYRW